MENVSVGKRHYYHARGDHQYCHPDRCIALGGRGRRDAPPVPMTRRVDPTKIKVPKVPDMPLITTNKPTVVNGKVSVREKYGLGDHGVVFYREMMKMHDWDAPCKRMLIESCRILDRLEYLHVELMKADWEERFPGRALVIAKDLAVAFRNLVVELYKQRDMNQDEIRPVQVNDVAALQRKFKVVE